MLVNNSVQTVCSAYALLRTSLFKMGHKPNRTHVHDLAANCTAREIHPCQRGTELARIGFDDHHRTALHDDRCYSTGRLPIFGAEYDA